MSHIERVFGAARSLTLVSCEQRKIASSNGFITWATHFILFAMPICRLYFVPSFLLLGANFVAYAYEFRCAMSSDSKETVCELWLSAYDQILYACRNTFIWCFRAEKTQINAHKTWSVSYLCERDKMQTHMYTYMPHSSSTVFCYFTTATP